MLILCLILLYVSENEDIKTSEVEQFNRLLKTKMWRYFSHYNMYSYLNSLQDFLQVTTIHLAEQFEQRLHREKKMTKKRCIKDCTVRMLQRQQNLS